MSARERTVIDVIRDLQDPTRWFGAGSEVCREAAELLAVLDSGAENALREVERLRAILDTPTITPFLEAAEAEAKHQVYRWGEEHDATKTAWDWFWTLGYLGGKAAHAALARDWDKALHHTVTAAAMLANWHRHLLSAKANDAIAEAAE